MTHDEALKICRILAETYRRDEWSAERHAVWSALLSDLPFAAVREAVLGWARNEKWPPTPAELRALAFDVKAAETEHARARIAARTFGPERQLPAAELAPAKPMTVTQLHTWRAAVGRPLADCACESCAFGKAILARKILAAERIDPTKQLTAEEQDEVERIRQWAQA